MSTTSSGITQEIEEELAKIGITIPKQVKCPWLIRFALRTIATSIERRELPLWLKILLNIRFGKFKTPDGIEYSGIRVNFKW